MVFLVIFICAFCVIINLALLGLMLKCYSEVLKVMALTKGKEK